MRPINQWPQLFPLVRMLRTIPQGNRLLPFGSMRQMGFLPEEVKPFGRLFQSTVAQPIFDEEGNVLESYPGYLLREVIRGLAHAWVGKAYPDSPMGTFKATSALLRHIEQSVPGLPNPEVHVIDLTGFVDPSVAPFIETRFARFEYDGLNYTVSPFEQWPAHFLTTDKANIFFRVQMRSEKGMALKEFHVAPWQVQACEPIAHTNLKEFFFKAQLIGPASPFLEWSLYLHEKNYKGSSREDV